VPIEGASPALAAVLAAPPVLGTNEAAPLLKPTPAEVVDTPTALGVKLLVVVVWWLGGD